LGDANRKKKRELGKKTFITVGKGVPTGGELKWGGGPTKLKDEKESAKKPELRGTKNKLNQTLEKVKEIQSCAGPGGGRKKTQTEICWKMKSKRRESKNAKKTGERLHIVQVTQKKKIL